MRPIGTKQKLEARRHRAMKLLAKGKTVRFVAATLNASLSSVVRWVQSYRKEGKKGLKSKPTPGRPPLLSPSQKIKLNHLLIEGPQAAGHTTNLWTLQRIGRLIHKKFGHRYTHVGVWKLMRQGLHWSWQKPEKRAIQRNEPAIRQWTRQAWSDIKKNSET